MFLGLRTAAYSAADLAAARQWYARVLEIAPYFDEPFYVGFNVGGFELGIVPEGDATLDRPVSTGNRLLGRGRRGGGACAADFARRGRP